MFVLCISHRRALVGVSFRALVWAVVGLSTFRNEMPFFLHNKKNVRNNLLLVVEYLQAPSLQILNQGLMCVWGGAVFGVKTSGSSHLFHRKQLIETPVEVLVLIFVFNGGKFIFGIAAGDVLDEDVVVSESEPDAPCAVGEGCGVWRGNQAMAFGIHRVISELRKNELPYAGDAVCFKPIQLIFSDFRKIHMDWGAIVGSPAERGVRE